MILEDLFLTITMLFLDNIRIKGPYINYNNIKKLPRIYRFIYKYLINLNKTLDRIKYTKVVIKLKS